MSERKSFQIIETVASGGTAVLFKAVQTSLDRVVALKKLHAHLTSDENFTRRFILEAKAAASLDHENIVHVIDFGVEEGSYQIVMEYIEGESLKRILDKWAPLPIDLALAITYQICLGLEHAHSKGIVHRDIKPGNVLLTKHGRVKITDFGLAKLTQSKTHETAANSILGTPLYMSPEQAFGESVDCRSDLFSLGTVLYEMLTGKQPFSSESYMGVIQNIINKSVPSPKRFNTDVPQPVEAILSRALAKNREARFRTASQFRKAIEKYLGLTRLKEAEDSLKSLLISEGETLAIRSALTKELKQKRGLKWHIAALAGVCVLAAAVFFAVNPDAIKRLRSLAEQLQSHHSDETSLQESALSDEMASTDDAIDLPSDSKNTTGVSQADTSDASATDPREAATEAATDEFINPARALTDSASAETSDTVQAAGEPDGKLAREGAAAKGNETSPKTAEGEAPQESKPAVKKGWLSISAKPLAEIYLDGRYVGDSPPPISLELTSGSHTLLCKNPQCKPYEETLRIVQGELSRRDIILDKLRGSISLAATEGAEFYIDGVLIGVTPIKEPIIVDVGRHQLTLRKVGYNVWTSEATVEANKVMPLKITLSRRY